VELAPNVVHSLSLGQRNRLSFSYETGEQAPAPVVASKAKFVPADEATEADFGADAATEADLDDPNALPASVLTRLSVLDAPSEIGIQKTPFSLTQREVIVGRSAESALSFPNTKKISRQHMRLAWTGKDFVIEDLGSTHGTQVDGDKLVANKVYSLEAGKNYRIVIGGADSSVTFEFEYNASSGPDDATQV
jgi:hypothetical protein